MARQLYEMQEWENLPSENTPISGARLEHIEQGIYDNSDKMALKEYYGDAIISVGRKPNSVVGGYSIGFGQGVTASGTASQSFGMGTTASGTASQSFGMGTTASGQASRAEGYYTKASGAYQNARGRFNVADTSGQFADIVGGGTSDDDRKNIYTLDWQGNAVYAGDVTNGQGVSLNSLKESIDYILSIIQPSEPDEEGGETT